MLSVGSVLAVTPVEMISVDDASVKAEVCGSTAWSHLTVSLAEKLLHFPASSPG
jgi:hypothetical protein